ncbi:MAG TPA: DUF3103 family protein [Micromonosporaceae bacterium]
MLSRTVRRSLLSLPVAAAMLAAAVTPPAYAHSDAAATAVPAAHAGVIASTTDNLARDLARTFADPAIERSLASAVVTAPVDLATVAPGTAFAQRVRAANRTVVAAKGLPSTVGSLLQVRLGDQSMVAALNRGEVPLVAATPTDDVPSDITAYTTSGDVVVLSTATVPTRPVLLVEVDTAKALPAGIDVMRTIFAERGVGDSGYTTLSTTGGFWATKIDSVYLSNDEEPWVKGAAEIYSIVGGFDYDGVARVADIVQMPYLDYDGQVYYPNQLLVYWNRYKYNLADVVMMEDDGDTNYQALATAICDALLSIADQGQYIPLVNAILDAIPDSWWTDDPDYVDSWYTLATTTSGRINGAAGNGWMYVEPYWVSEL